MSPVSSFVSSRPLASSVGGAAGVADALGGSLSSSVLPSHLSARLCRTSARAADAASEFLVVAEILTGVSDADSVWP